MSCASTRNLFVYASNKSEIAVGYCTLYGDMCGGLSVIGDLTKTQVYAMSRWINRRGAEGRSRPLADECGRWARASAESALHEVGRAAGRCQDIRVTRYHGVGA